MKLSEAIELTITSGIYPKKKEYMCYALPHINAEGHIPAVVDMVKRIVPTCISLAGALTLVGGNYPSDRREQEEYCLQVYCWWVFDLKRKGL